MEDKRNIIMAILLTGLILFGWPYVAGYFFPTPPAQQTAEKSASTGKSDVPAVAVDTPAKAVALGSALTANPRVLVETPKLKGSINLEGARIDDLVLLTHREELSKKSPPIRLFAPSGTAKSHFARFGWTGEGTTLPTDKTVWTPSGTKLTPETPVTLSWTNPEGNKFDIRLSIDKDYLLTAEQSFTNAGTASAKVAPFGIISRKGMSPDPDSWNIHVGPMGVFGGEIVNINYDEVAEAPKGEIDYTTTGGWAGETEKYWLSALIPDQKVKIAADFKTGDGYNWTRIRNAELTEVAPGATAKQSSQLFAGAKEVEVLQNYTKKLGIPYLDYSIDWGWFWFIAIPFFWILHWFFGVFGNFGVAIIGLTIVVRMFMFPVAQKQFASMAQMRAVQPKMKTLQERYKDDKPRMQQEIMKLYQEEKVNPLRRLPAYRAADSGLLRALQNLDAVDRNAAPALRLVAEGSVCARSVDPGQPVRIAALRPADVPRHRRAANSARYHNVADAAPEPDADGRSPEAGLGDHAVVPDVHHGPLCGWLAALLGGFERDFHRAAEMALFKASDPEAAGGEGS